MSDQTPQQPGWGPPPTPPPQPGWGPPQSPSPKRKRRPGVLGWIGIGVAVLILLAVIGAIVGQNDNTTTTSGTTTALTEGATIPSADTAAPPTTEAPKQTGPATAKLGQTLQFEDSFGKHSADITVVRKKVSTGDEFDKPSNGFYVGLLVRVKAFQDGITVPQFYALVGSKHFDSTIATGFEPDLNIVGNLNKGETSEGWVVFDVPSRNGKAVMQEFLSEKAQATWSY